MRTGTDKHSYKSNYEKKGRKDGDLRKEEALKVPFKAKRNNNSKHYL